MRHGILLIDKPAGITSHDVVLKARKALGESSIGHLGTLDPAATGLMALAVGKKALKLLELFMGLPKEYEARVRFGAVSTTYDQDGTIEEIAAKPGWAPPDELYVRRVIAERFVGRVSQVPPAHSAVHVGGERAYRKARQGRSVEIPARMVDITTCDILSYTYPDLTLLVACSAGTYIRSLAHDLGQVLGCGAYLAALRRTTIGEWGIASACSEEDIAWPKVLPLKDMLTGFPKRELTDEEYTMIRQGKNLPGPIEHNTVGWFGGLPVALFEQTKEGFAHARKVF